MIREYTNKDIDTIVDIWLNASIVAHDFISVQYWQSKVDDMKHIYIPTSSTWVYEENGVIMGFVALIDSFIPAIFVNPTAQSKGVGKKLIDHAKLMYDTIELCVYSENKRAIAFYIKQGFEILEERVEENTGCKELLMHYQR